MRTKIVAGNWKLNNDKEGSKNLIKELNIPIINLKKEVFDKHPDKLSLFPFRAPGHYTPEGYKLIAEKIIELIN